MRELPIWLIILLLSTGGLAFLCNVLDFVIRIILFKKAIKKKGDE